ncbi:hypothetical protein OsI_12557 [Oryza sativa Indica Group]|uniref:Uncharacterized protein n=1 Tax=Oryza sativa subsp. indica TaxID=39946 RepID=A2XJD4_ORYSI|nr:hypothetical protein OsI_12557 [Oryza sativa Indica Group]
MSQCQPDLPAVKAAGATSDNCNEYDDCYNDYGCSEHGGGNNDDYGDGGVDVGIVQGVPQNRQGGGGPDKSNP